MDVTTNRTVPTLLRFALQNEAQLGLTRTEYHTDYSRVSYVVSGTQNAFTLTTNRDEDKVTNFIFLAVEFPPKAIPDWVQEIIDAYETVVSLWSGKHQEVVVQYVYGVPQKDT